jgi:hypothetical protein
VQYSGLFSFVFFSQCDILLLHRERFRQALNPPTDEGLTSISTRWSQPTRAGCGDESRKGDDMNTSTPVLKQAKADFREAVSALLHEGLTADEIHALANAVIKNGL